MKNGVVVEICVESVEYAVAAERGGADRIELCSELFSGGATPSRGLIAEVRRRVYIPIHVLIRPRLGDFCYSDCELDTMECDIAALKQLGADGIVLGVLEAGKRIDLTRTARLVKLAAPIPVTFHKAFDECQDLLSSLGLVIKTGANCLLTSGGAATAADGVVQIEQLVKQAAGRITIMPGGGIDASNVHHVLAQTRACYVHTSLGRSRVSPRPRSASPVSNIEMSQFEARVRAIRQLLEANEVRP